MTSNAQPRKRPVTADATSSSAKRRHRKRKQSKIDADRSTTPSNPHQKQQRRSGAPQEHLQPSHLCTYSRSASKWTRLTDPPPPSRFPTSLRFLTYNVWSSSPDHTQSQTTAILDILEKSRVDVIALQEISQHFFEVALKKQDWMRNEWAITSLDEYWRVAGKDGQGKGKKEGLREGVVLMVRKELVSESCEVGLVRLKRANNERAKAAVVLKLYEGDEEKVRILTSHFSSLPENSKLRRSQYSTAASLLRSSPQASHSVLLADFNASSSPEFDTFSSFFVDVCPTIPKNQLANLTPAEKQDLQFRHRPTFGELYPLITVHSKPRKPRRIDRVFVGRGTRFSQYRELGGKAIEGERDQLGKNGKRYPSDHLAIGIKIEIG